MNSKERMNAWLALSEPKVEWETFKRLVGQLGVEKGIEKAKTLRLGFPLVAKKS